MMHNFVLIFALKWIIVSSNPINISGCKSNVGNCQDLNELCEFIPLPHILCEQEKVKKECPRLCNSCPEVTTVQSETSTDNNWQTTYDSFSENNRETFTETNIQNYTVTESG